MSNIKDLLKKSQSNGDSKSYTKLDISLRIDVKEKDGKPMFHWYDKSKEEGKRDVYHKGPIKGILIGDAMVMSSFDEDLGSNGGQYYTGYYFNKQHQNVVFHTGGSKPDFKGTGEEIEHWMTTTTSSKGAKKKKVLFILTDKGLVAVETNLSIAIDQMKTKGDKFQEYMIALLPKKYDPETESISAKAKEYLGKFAAKNPPKYAEILLDQPIEKTAIPFETVAEATNTFTQYREERIGGTGAEAEMEEAENSEPEYKEPPADKKSDDNITGIEEEEEDDQLPF